MEYPIANKPSLNIAGRPLKIVTNYFKIKHQLVYKYALHISPCLPDTSANLINSIVEQVRIELTSIIGSFVVIKNCVYGVKSGVSETRIEIETTYEGVEYFIKVKKRLELNLHDKELADFYKIAYLKALRKLKMTQIYRNYLDMDKIVKVRALSNKFELLRGYYTSIQNCEYGMLVKIDISHRVLRTSSVLDYIKKIRNKSRFDDHDKIRKKLVGRTVITKYFSKSYKIDDVDFERNPASKFSLREGDKEIGLIDYYMKAYNITIQDMSQPLLIHNNLQTRQRIELVPELCYLTGLTQTDRTNVSLMKEISEHVSSQANQRIKECRGLFGRLKDDEDAQNELDKWHLDFEEFPIMAEGQRLNAGTMLMGREGGKRVEFFVDDSHDLDRKVQNVMYSQPILHKWAIFAERDDRSVKDFFSKIKKSFYETFKMQPEKPDTFYVNSKDFNAWKDILEKECKDQQYEVVILILPSNGRICSLYNEIKQLLLTTLPIPSQVIRSETLRKEEKISAICNKIIIQIYAKIGGIPWVIQDFPLTNIPTMIIGIDINKNKDVIAICASVNRNLTQHWSKIKKDISDVANSLEDLIKQAIFVFEQINKIFPRRIIVYRNSVPQHRRKDIMINEVPAIEAAFISLRIAPVPQILFILVDKNNNTRLMSVATRGLYDPNPGTVLDHGITKNGVTEFYMVSQKQKQGECKPTHYLILHDTVKENIVKVQQLSYKLCYMYYNVGGSTRIPAPLQNALKLSKLANIEVNKQLENLKGLYYL